MNGSLDFERPIIELERKIDELKNITSDQKMEFKDEIKRLEDKLQKVKVTTYKNLTPWQRVQLARHPQRPYTMDYINMIMSDFVEFHGDGLFSDDKAIITGFARLNGIKVAIMGHQKGRDTKENLMRNFGSAHPEGYRKAMRIMRKAEKFKLPIVVFIDTPGAYPGIGAEERGQAEAIAFNLKDMIMIKTPIIVFVIGEGGSGGALGIGIGDCLCVLENAYYSVISPEGCAAILWKDRARAPEAAKALRLTAADLLELGIADEVISEPLGGAHREPEKVGDEIKEAIKRNFAELTKLSEEQLLKTRYEKFRKIGVFKE